MIHFLQPWWLLALLPVAGVAAAYVWRWWHRHPHALRFSNLALLQRLAPAGTGWRRHLAATVFLLALVVLTAALARPAVEREVPVERATVVLAVDVSLSMQATDVSPSRLAAAQQAATSFTADLPESHQLGLVSFARSAQVLVSPTTDRQRVTDAVAGLELAEATATGEAVFTSLQAVQQAPGARADEPPPARILLLTDGYRTYGRSVADAAQAAAAADVPVSTVAFGTDEGTVEIEGQTYQVPVDRGAMARLAETTGGQYYEAESLEELTAVYEDMGSAVAYRTEPYEITQWYVGGALLLALSAGVLSLLWTPRLP